MARNKLMDHAYWWIDKHRIIHHVEQPGNKKHNSRGIVGEWYHDKYNGI